MIKTLLITLLSACSSPAPDVKLEYSRDQPLQVRSAAIDELLTRCCHPSSPSTAACDGLGRVLEIEEDQELVAQALAWQPTCLSSMTERVPTSLTRRTLRRATHSTVIDLLALREPTPGVVESLVSYLDSEDNSLANEAAFEISLYGERELSPLVPSLETTNKQRQRRLLSLFGGAVEHRLRIPALEPTLFRIASADREQDADVTLLRLHEMPEIDADLDAIERGYPEHAARLLGVREATCGVRGDRLLAGLMNSSDPRVKYVAKVSARLRAERCK